MVAALSQREGVKVVGSAGSDEKVKFLLEELKFDAAFNYRTQDTEEVSLSLYYLLLACFLVCSPGFS